VQSTGDRYRDTAALTVRTDGVDLPPFFIKGQVGNASKKSGRRPEKGKKPVRGMSKALMKEYVDHITPFLSEPCLILLDRASSHTSKEVLEYMKQWKTAKDDQLLIPLLMPAKTAFLLSPLDNGANSAFKAHFYRLDRSTFALKKNAVRSAWDSVSNESLRNICKNCGLLGDETLQSIRDRFMKEVRGVVPEQLEYSLELFEAWMGGSIRVEGAELHRGVMLERPAQTDDSTLDGRKWVGYGGK